MKSNVPDSELILYQTEDGLTKVEVRLLDETVWLNQAQMSELFDKDKRTISEHIKNIFNEGELQEDSVVRNFRTNALTFDHCDMSVPISERIFIAVYASMPGMVVKSAFVTVLIFSGALK